MTWRVSRLTVTIKDDDNGCKPTDVKMGTIPRHALMEGAGT